MPEFHYKATDDTGGEVSGEIVADSRNEAAAKLESRGLTVESLDPVTAAPPVSDERGLRGGDVAAIAESFADVANSELPLEPGLRALSDAVPDRRMRFALRSVSDRLANGESLQAILESGRGPRPLLELLRAGLATNRLGAVLDAWLNYARQGASIRRRIWTGLAYSFVLVGALLAMVLFLMLYVVPDFSIIYDDFGPELPGLTQSVLSVSRFLSAHVWLCGAAFLGLVILTVFSWQHLARAKRRRFLCAVPLIGPAVRTSSLSSFCHLLATFVEHGVAMPAALRAAAFGSRDAEIERACRGMADDVERGVSLEQSARKQRAMPTRLAHIFRWSNRETAFPAAMHASGDMFEGESRLRAAMVALIVEPIVIVGIAVIFSVFFLAFFMPLIRLISDLT